MADSSLNVPVVVQAQRIDATLLPSIFSLPYQLYVVQQGTDFGNVAGKANQAGAGAYDAQVKNDEQDIILADHEKRISAAEVTLADHENRITVAEGTLAKHEVRITAAEESITSQGERLTVAEGKIETLQENIEEIKDDYISKSATDEQSLSSSLNVVTGLLIDGVKVVGPQQTGWTSATGTANKGSFNADITFTVSDPPTQSEIQAIAAALTAERQRTKALEDVLRSHGLIE